MQSNIPTRVLMVLATMALMAPAVRADEDGERRGEVGVQIGVRWADRDIVPEDSSGLGFVYGVEVEIDVVPPWFVDLKRVPPGDVASLKYARGHGDVIKELGLTT